MKNLLFLILLMSFVSCSIFNKNRNTQNVNDEANRVLIALKGYQPIDPITIIYDIDSLGANTRLIDVFPNEASRVAIGTVNQNGSISYGPIDVVRVGKTYSVVMDYIKYTTTSIPALYYEEINESKSIISKRKDTIVKKEINEIASLRTAYGTVKKKSNYEVSISKKNNKNNLLVDSNHSIKVPVYVGVGLRIQASVTVLKDSLNINIGSLSGLGVAGSQNQISGNFVIQTLGISGENITPSMPIADKINETTIQVAMQSIATMKSKIYDNNTTISPHVIAFGLTYNIDGAKELIESTIHTSPPYLYINSNNRIMFYEDPNSEIFKIDSFSN